jgi:hypothetical protein
MDLEAYARLRPLLFHGTATSNLACIRSERALHSALTLSPNHCSERRTDEVRLQRGEHSIVLRDQCALHRGHVDLEDGWRSKDFLDALNIRIFFWPGNENGPIKYGRRLFEAYRFDNQTVLRIPFRELLQTNPNASTYFCKFNSGGPRTFAGRRSPRGPNTFLLAHKWPYAAWQVAEVSFDKSLSLPEQSEFLDETRVWKRLLD